MNTADKLQFVKDYEHFKIAFQSAVHESGNDPNEFWEALDSYTAQELICDLITMGIILTYNPKD